MTSIINYCYSSILHQLGPEKPACFCRGFSLLVFEARRRCCMLESSDFCMNPWNLNELPSCCAYTLVAAAHLSQFLQLCLAALQLLLQLRSLLLTAVIHHLQLLQLHLQTVTLQDTQPHRSDSSSTQEPHVCSAKHQKYKLNGIYPRRIFKCFC